MTNSADWIASPRAAAALARLEPELMRAAETSDRAVHAVAKHLLERGGKRLRPALLFVVAEYGEADPELLLRAATAVELVHVASLYHDDVIDRAPQRRGVHSANRRWGNGVATAVGTFLMSRALERSAALGAHANGLVAGAVMQLCTGQLEEIENAYDIGLAEETHLDVLARKTATLFELPCALGALLAGLSADRTRALTSYGRALGQAFQITDDTLDLCGTARLGKRRGTDLREGVYSLAVLRALAAGPAAGPLREVLLRERLDDADIAAALRLVAQSGTIATAVATAQSAAASALDALWSLPEGAATESLHNLAHLAVDRSI